MAYTKQIWTEGELITAEKLTHMEEGIDAAQTAEGSQGPAGADGYSPTANVTQAEDGVVITITDQNGTTTATITNGRDGYTPVKGTDYWTAADQAAMVEDVLAALPTWEGGSY